MEDLYLPPRSRKTLQQINQSEGMCFYKHLQFLPHKCETYRNEMLYLGRGRKRKKVQEDDSEEEGEETEDSEAEDSDDERPKKRGRPRVLPRENIKSFTDAEVIILFYVRLFDLSFLYVL